MGLGGVISSLLSLSAKLLPAVVASEQAPSSSSAPAVDQNHKIKAELEKLMRMLERIKATLYDAEQREIGDLSVKLWLNELKRVAYDAEDVLDEYHYEVLRAQVEAREASPPDSRKRNLIQREMKDLSLKLLQVQIEASDDCPKKKLIQVPSGMLDQIEQIRSRFDEITKDRIALQLSEGDGPRRCNNDLQIAPSSHFVVESNIFGRESEKDKLIELLSPKSDGVSVVTIVGIGGIGKTTLAQLAYNDQRIRKKFDKFGWICVSEDFNVERLTKESVESITGNECGITNLSALQEKIRKEINGKKVLLVLDDDWNEKKSLWDSFLAPFMSASFAKILVTTRNEPVARIIQTEPTLNLGYLPFQQCWQLFKHYAFGGVECNQNPNLIEIGKQIMNKCGMLPLAMKSIANLLRHEAEEESWREILESELWESNVKNEIFPPLQITYARLPTHLKSCFLYCSIFPKTYCYHVEYLVNLWIYQGFIECKGNKTAEKIGFEYAQQLCQRSLFERINEGGDFKMFKLHDIFHDLARYNSENGCYSIEAGKLPIFPNVLYNLCIADFVNLIDPIPFEQFTALRTLIIGCSIKNGLSTFDISMAPKLRALEIAGACNWKFQSLSSVGNLKHLRYLSLSDLLFETLPECICSLYSLQNLTLQNICFKELPSKIGNLISLEELQIEHCSGLQVLPESLCQLKALRKLCLSNCVLLKELPSDMGSLKNLETLEIINTGVSYLPPSLNRFVGTQSLKIELNCKTIGWLKDFPDLGGTLCLCGLKNIPNLMDVQCANLVSMHNLEQLRLSWDGCCYWDTRQIDGSVLQLIIQSGQNIFLEDQSSFSGMVCLQPHPYLRKLEIKDYSGITFPEWIGNLCKLKYFKITFCGSLQVLELLPLELEELEILGCHQLVSMPRLQKLKSLVKLSISTCGKLLSLMEPSGSSWLGLTNLASLRSLEISNCLHLQVLDDELLPVEPCKVKVFQLPGLRKWCIQHQKNYLDFLSSSLPTVNDDDALSSTTETMFTVSFNEKFNRSIKSWMRGRILGNRPFSKVYEAISNEGFFFAVKEVLIDESVEGSIIQLLEEIAIWNLWSQCEHENIVQCYGMGKGETKLYIFLELVARGSLKSLYQKYHLQDTHVLTFTRQILYGLVYLHERNIGHGNIQCANILVHANGSVKLAGFESAKKMTKFNILKSFEESGYWMAPEVVRANRYRLKADIRSLGCTVLEMLTRQIPYPKIDWFHAVLKIARGEPPPIPNYLSREAQDFIKQCVRKNPGERPSAVQLLEHPFVKIPLPLLCSPPASQS